MWTKICLNLRKAADALLEADREQSEMAVHRLDSFSPLVEMLKRTADLLAENKLNAARKAFRLGGKLKASEFPRDEIAAAFGGLTSGPKAEASRKNGRSGGRPRKDGLPCRRKPSDVASALDRPNKNA